MSGNCMHTVLIRHNMQELQEKYYIGNSVLSMITGISEIELDNFQFGGALEVSQTMQDFLFMVTKMLLHGFLMDPDDRLVEIVKTMINGFCLSPYTISLYSKVHEDKIIQFMVNPKSIDSALKYQIAMAVMMLHSIFKKPDDEHQKRQMEHVARQEEKNEGLPE